MSLLIDELVGAAARAATAGGLILKDMMGRYGKADHKGERDMVTAADRQSEAAIVSAIHQVFPDHAILTEETGLLGEPSPSPLPAPACAAEYAPARRAMSEIMWLVDPLDGTTNYCHAFPFFGVSIACMKAQQVVAGAVYCPLSDELFVAGLGQGAFLNDRRIHVSDTRALGDSMLATGFPYDIKSDPLYNFDNLIRMESRVQAIRRLGAAAIDLAYVACGRLDSYWESKLAPWDTAAGALLVTEAGGRISDLNGERFDPFKGEVVASNPHIHEQVLDVLTHSKAGMGTAVDALKTKAAQGERGV